MYTNDFCYKYTYYVQMDITDEQESCVVVWRMMLWEQWWRDAWTGDGE